MFRRAWWMALELRPKREASASQGKVWSGEQTPDREQQQVHTSRKTLKISRKGSKASMAGNRHSGERR